MVTPSRHIRRALAAAAAASALGLTTVALGASGGEPTSAARAATATASAYARDDGKGPQGAVHSSGNGAQSASGTSVSTSTSGGKGNALARASVRDVKLFGGLVTADSVLVRASASGAGSERVGRVGGLVINGHEQRTQSRRHVFNLAGYGRLVAIDDSGSGIVGLNAKLTRAYGDYPAGSTAKVAYASASASDEVAPEPQPEPKPPKPKPKPKPEPAPEPKPQPKPKPKPERRKPPRTHILLTGKGYVFPIYGKHSYTDDYGAARADTGTHEGNDIFAATGTPVVAVCDGSLNRVGTLPIAGNRLWVKCDKGGDSFFYAHLSAYATDTRSGLDVKAGTVLGFVGSTGDAEQTPPHCHFEVHPGDGPAVDPYPFLRAWEGHRDVPAAAWVRQNGTTSGEQPGTLVVVKDYLAR
jgi:murein DD-endopeptidase MepM/ murein hydrolase activator NlpD